MGKREVLKIIRDSRNQLRHFGVKRIGIFGSFGTSAQKPKSDIDILVEFRPEKKTFDNYMDLRFLLERLLHRKVDLVIKDALKSRIRQRIIRETIYA